VTSSEVLLLQRELHKLAEQNREDHKLVRQALTRLQGDLSALSDRLHDVEDTDKQVAAIEQDREDRRKRTLGLVGAIAASAGVISGIIVALIDRV
jgi:predicted  nucleic acid-binding Zn-ribbon protein